MQTLDTSMGGNFAINAARTKPPALPKKPAPTPTDRVELSAATTGNKVTPSLGGQAATDEVMRMVAAAKASVQVEVYRLGYDKMVDLLASQARAGVKVQVLLDPTPGYDPKDAAKQETMTKYLKSAGVQVLRYPIDEKDKIDHVKLLIVDGKTAVIGGLNWDQHSHANLDANVTIEGDAVKDLSRVFTHDWKLSGGGATPTARPSAPQLPAGDKGATVRVVTTDEGEEGIRSAVRSGIDGAKKSIKMLAFALADKEVIEALIRAKKDRGVDVKIMLDPNKPVAYVNEKSKRELEAAGIAVRYLRINLDTQEKLHAKMVQIDDDKAILGSANFTYKGLTVNHEADVEVVSKAMGPALTNFFEDLWEHRSLQKLPNLPDFEEVASKETYGESVAHELFGWQLETYHPDEHHNWVGKRKEAVMDAFEKYSKSGAKCAPAAPEEEQLGSLAAFLTKRQVWEIKPPPGSYEKVWKDRVQTAQHGEQTVPAQVARYKKEMVDLVKSPDLKALLQTLLDKAPEGFYKSPSSATGKYHPADEIRVADVTPHLDPVSDAEEAKYPGGGLVLHSRRNMELARHLCDYYDIDGRKRDEVLMALALHDVMKFVAMKDFQNWKPGDPVPWGKYTTPDHAHVGAEYVRRMDPSGGEATKEVRRYIDMHMGAWNAPEPTPPKDNAEKVISLADYLASSRNFYVKV